MSKEYTELMSELSNKRMDLFFHPYKLDKLTDNERIEIENIIFEYCVNGFDMCTLF